MTAPPGFVQPPSGAVWLVNLFTPAEEAESIQGDLLEEFSHIAAKAGVAAARSWYWRQTVKTVAYLSVTGFRIAPWSSAAAVVGGFLLLGFVSKWCELGIFAVLHRYRVFDHYFKVYVFFATDGIAIGHVIVSFFVGCMVALPARGREMVATTALALVLGAMAVAAWLVWVAEGEYFLLWTLPWHAAGLLAIIVGGAIVRTRRSVTARHSDA